MKAREKTQAQMETRQHVFHTFWKRRAKMVSLDRFRARLAKYGINQSGLGKLFPG